MSKRHLPQLQSNPASIHKGDDKALPFSPPMKASYMSLRKLDPTSWVQKVRAGQTANGEAYLFAFFRRRSCSISNFGIKMKKEARMISSVKLWKHARKIIQAEWVTDPNRACAYMCKRCMDTVDRQMDRLIDTRPHHPPTLRLRFSVFLLCGVVVLVTKELPPQHVASGVSPSHVHRGNSFDRMAPLADTSWKH